MRRKQASPCPPTALHHTSQRRDCRVELDGYRNHSCRIRSGTAGTRCTQRSDYYQHVLPILYSFSCVHDSGHFGAHFHCGVMVPCSLPGKHTLEFSSLILRYAHETPRLGSQLLHMSIRRSSRQDNWAYRFATTHLKWTFRWWCHHVQLLSMGAFGVFAALKHDMLPPLPSCTPTWIYCPNALLAAKIIYIMLLVPFINNVMFGLPFFLLAAAGAQIYLAQSDERWRCLSRLYKVNTRTICRVIIGFWGVGVILMSIPLVIVIEAMFGKNVSKGQSWDFGSVFAFALVMVPLEQVIRSVFRVLRPRCPSDRSTNTRPDDRNSSTV
jgi:hypothetical protein